MKKKLLLIAALLIAISPRILGQGGHSATLTWTPSADASCVSPCTLTFNVYRGTTPGGEATTPLNAAPLTSPTYVDSTVVLGNTYYYEVEEVATSGSLVESSGPSNEVAGIFPNAPGSPTGMQ